MGLGPRLELRQSQQLVMTQQLQLAIKLLALTNVELEAYIGDELEKNPLLSTSDGGDIIEALPPPEAGVDASSRGLDELLGSSNEGSANAEAPLDIDYTG
jgi:RNA polymerase sigma-54 factor